MEDRYDTDLVKDPFRGASSILKKEENKEQEEYFLATEQYESSYISAV